MKAIFIRGQPKASSTYCPLDYLSSGPVAQGIPSTSAFQRNSSFIWMALESEMIGGITGSAHMANMNCSSCRLGDTRPEIIRNQGQWGTSCSLAGPHFHNIFHTKGRRRKTTKHRVPVFPYSLCTPPHLIYTPPDLVPQRLPWAIWLVASVLYNQHKPGLMPTPPKWAYSESSFGVWNTVRWPQFYAKGLSCLAAEPDSVWKVIARSSIRGNLIKVSWLSRPSQACQFVTWQPAAMCLFDEFFVLCHTGSGCGLVWLSFPFLLLW